MDGCTKQYHCASDIYVLSFLALNFIIYRAFDEPGHAKDVVDSLNCRENWMLELAMAQLINPELNNDDHNSFKFVKVHEN